MHLRQATRHIPFLLLVLVLAVCDRHAAQAQERWPPWQSYGEAEDAAHTRHRHKKSNAAVDLGKLSQEIEQLRQAGKIAEAIPVAEKAVAATERLRGPNHPDVAKALDTLAELYIAQSKYAEAEPLLKRSLAILERTAGPDNVDVAQTLDNLGTLYEKQGRSADAERLRKRAVAIREKTASPGSPGVVYKKKSTITFEDSKIEGDLAKPSAPSVAAPPDANEKAQAEAAEAEHQAKRAEEEPAKSKDSTERAIQPRMKAAARAAPPAPSTPPAGVTTAPPGAAIPEASDLLAKKSEGGGGPPEAPSACVTACSAAPAAAPEEQKDWDVVPVFYGTDREQEPNPKRVSYSSDRGQRLELGRALVTIPKNSSGLADRAAVDDPHPLL